MGATTAHSIVCGYQLVNPRMCEELEQNPEKEKGTGYLIRGIHPFSTAKAATDIDQKTGTFCFSDRILRARPLSDLF